MQKAEADFASDSIILSFNYVRRALALQELHIEFLSWTGFDRQIQSSPIQ
jgi:hypothetical protein